ncbi:MAG TPA: DNA repair protein RecN [Chloroflexi bacterium]|nr:DNA repair protein RecN [Chloroflexota bacterium]
MGIEQARGSVAVLRELHIRNFAIIDTLDLMFEPGFNILTGETGAGKSILVDAMLVMLGGRADMGMIRSGANSARVEGMFVLPPLIQSALRPLLEREGLEGESPEILWLARELRSSGRTVARVNGRVVSVSILRELAEGLVDVHGQSEHLSLLRVREHLDLLDRFAGLEELRAEVSRVAHEIFELRRELASLMTDERERMQRIDLLKFQVEEIKAANLRPGEQEELEAELVRLSNAQQLMNLASGILARLDEGEDVVPSVLDMLGRSQRDMTALVRIDQTLSPYLSALDDIVYQAEDLVRVLRDYVATIEFNPRRQAAVEERLILLRRLERKYGGDLSDVLAYAEKASQELRQLERRDERLAELEEEERSLVASLVELAVELSTRRQEAAAKLAAAVEEELADLRMTGAHFGVAFRWREEAGGLPLSEPLPGRVVVTRDHVLRPEEGVVHQPHFDLTGIDQVEFLIAPNVGEGLKPLARIASGGEMSRLMLALKTVLARADRTPTLIFDEIDQGIGGRIGAIVGAKLWQLTGVKRAGDLQHQVLCITHLPQLASFGDVHFQVSKTVLEGRTVTRVRRLEGQERVYELAQMLGASGEAGLQSAYEILEQAEMAKRSPDMVKA